MNIRVLKREEIDEAKWEACVRSATNGSVFAQTWFLDIVCPDWEALVSGDYEVLLPLPVTRNAGIKHVYSPDLTPYTGIVNKVPVDRDLVWTMLQTIPYVNVRLVLNAHNKLPFRMAKRLAASRYVVLDLISDMERIESGFAPELGPVVKLYAEKKLTVIRALNVTEYIRFAQDNADDHDVFMQLKQLLPFALRYKSAGLYAAFDSYNQMVAVAFLLKSNGRLSLMHCTASDADLKGVKAIIYHIIRHNATSNLTLEFPFYSHEIGTCFTGAQHVCLIYKKGLSKWIDLR